MRSHYAAAVFALASIVLVSVPGNEARASDGTTTTGYVFMFGLVLVGLGALGVLLLGSALRRVHRSRLGREPRRQDVAPWEWFFISCIPRPTPDYQDSGGDLDLHPGRRTADGGAGDFGGDAGGGGGGGDGG
jgi:hypothetical protein